MKGPFSPSARRRGDIIVLSGLDGSGKSTQAALCAERLVSEGIAAEALWNRWEPGLTAPAIRLAKRSLRASSGPDGKGYPEFRDAKRRAMRGGPKRALWQILVWSEYAWQVRRRLSRPMRRGAVVVSDRYVYDTLIDVAVNFSIPPRRMADLMDHPLLALFPKPFLAIFIDIDPDCGAARKSDGTPAAYLADRREYYREMARILDAPLVDGGRPVEAVFEAVWASLAAWRAARPGKETR